MSSAAMSAGAKALKSFRINQLKNLKQHVIHNGPLPPPSTPLNPATPHRLPNPFIPHRNPKTGRWAPPAVSLRRQADLVKRAKESNALYLLPPGPKNPQPSTVTAEAAAALARGRFGGVPGQKMETRHHKQLEQCWMNPVEWVGEPKVKEVAGAELGTRLYAAKKRMFKGHRWERLKEAREGKRKILMRDMARRVRNYKAVRRGVLNPQHALLTRSLRTTVLPQEETEPAQAFELYKSAEIALLVPPARRALCALDYTINFYLLPRWPSTETRAQ
ncbi:hypothetical protein LshimejAT787_1101410 [Lyophyllum shimeji]|uniref:Large ribosomal subunit protein mL59 domain-containing protein n=1 Tax=Lyophyllum shimeji TaxID=47721 RepID=A0A9P3PUX5_LYOSH|nr:hypothetical protein LshimejAT787_1101410 [Lyophyllum shimeji]